MQVWLDDTSEGLNVYATAAECEYLSYQAEVDDATAERWIEITKQYIEMQRDIDARRI